MMNLTVSISGETTGDLELALEEVLRLVAEEYTSGANRNDTGSFQFNVTEAEDDR